MGELCLGSLKPPDVKPNTDMTPEQKAAEKKWEDANYKAVRIITNTLDAKMVTRIMGSEDFEELDAKKIWTQIKDLCSTLNVGEKALQFNRFTTFKYNESKPPQQNFDDFDDITRRLELAKVKLDLDLVKATLLNSLPDSWNQFKQGWNSNPSKSLSELKVAIECEAIRRKQYDTSEEVTAMMAKFSLKKKPRGQGNRKWSQTSTTKKTIVCFRCGKKGHRKKECYTNMSEKKNFNFSAHDTEACIIETLTASVSNPIPSNIWTIDSAATHSFCRDRRMFENYQQFPEPKEVLLGGSQSLRAVGFGTVELILQGEGKAVRCRLPGTLHVPSIRRNLISFANLMDGDWRIWVNKNEITLEKDGARVRVTRMGNLFTLRAQENSVEGNSTEVATLSRMHRIFGHVNKQKVKQLLAREHVEFVDDKTDCTACMAAKIHAATYHEKPSEVKPKEIGHVHTDLCTMQVRSLGNALHFMCITDSYSRFRKVYFLKDKTEAAQHIEHFINWWKTQCSAPLKTFRCDRGGEFLNAKVHLIRMESAGFVCSCRVLALSG